MLEEETDFTVVSLLCVANMCMNSLRALEVSEIFQNSTDRPGTTLGIAMSGRACPLTSTSKSGNDSSNSNNHSSDSNINR